MLNKKIAMMLSVCTLVFAFGFNSLNINADDSIYIGISKNESISKPNIIDFLNLKNYLINDKTEYIEKYDYNQDSSINLKDLLTVKKTILNMDFSYTMKNINFPYGLFSNDTFTKVITSYDELISFETEFNIDLNSSEIYNRKYFQNNILCIGYKILPNCNMIVKFNGITNQDGTISVNYDYFDQSVMLPMYSSKGLLLEIPKSCYHGEDFQLNFEYHDLHDEIEVCNFQDMGVINEEDSFETFKITSYDELLEFEKNLSNNKLSTKYDESYFKDSFLYINYITDNDNAKYTYSIELNSNLNCIIDKYQNSATTDISDYKGSIIAFELPNAFDIFDYNSSIGTKTVYDTDENRSELECSLEHIEMVEFLLAGFLFSTNIKSVEELQKCFEKYQEYNLSSYIDASKYDENFFENSYLHISRLDNSYCNQYDFTLEKTEYFVNHIISDVYFDTVLIWGNKEENPNFIQEDDSQECSNLLLITLPKDYSDCSVRCMFYNN